MGLCLIDCVGVGGWLFLVVGITWGWWGWWVWLGWFRGFWVLCVWCLGFVWVLLDLDCGGRGVGEFVVVL